MAEWGKPDRTYVASGDEVVRSGWSSFGGGFYKGKEVYEVWVYGDRQTELVFDGRKRLANWKTPPTGHEPSGGGR